MKRTLIVIFTMFVLACGRADSPDGVRLDWQKRVVLTSKAEQYKQWWHPETSCDALLFNSLSVVGGASHDLLQYRNESDRWFRTPTKDCYPERSKSSISRDMFLGVMWWAWVNQDLDTLERIYQYGAANTWVMGEGVPSRTVMTPVLVGTLSKAICKLGGTCRAVRHTPAAWGAVFEGFQRHLQLLHILLRADIDGGLTTPDRNAILGMWQNHSRNPLVAYAYGRWVTGNLNPAAELLLNEDWYPKDRLPASRDRCSPWLPERDPATDNYLPCPDKGHTHSGGDLMFVWALMKRALR